jgi:hypothetical protein
MGRRTTDEDEWEDDWGSDGDEPTVPCRYCRREIHEDSVRCPYCEQYLSAEDEVAPARKPWWLVLGVLVCLYLVYRWIAGG